MNSLKIVKNPNHLQSK